jgi:hypothetical protein
MKKIIMCGFVLLAFTGICLCQTVSAPKTTAVLGDIVECPTVLSNPGVGVLTGVPRNLDQTIKQEFLDKIPQGWDFRREESYSGQAYRVVNNRIDDNKFVCLYGISTPGSFYWFVSISKPIPANKSCKVMSGYKFQCSLKKIDIK